MKVNIGIPVYNGGHTLGRVLENIIGQFQDRQSIIVVNDGSTDRSNAIALLRKIRVINHIRNLGLAASRNTILINSECDILIFFDADAAPRKNCIETLVEPFQDPDVVAVGGRGEEANCQTKAALWRAKNTPQSHGLYRIENDWMLMGLCVAFRKQALMDIGGFDSCFRYAGEDVDISIRLKQNGGKLVYIPTAIVDHLPDPDLSEVTHQAYKHAKFATYAMMKNGINPTDYAVDSAKCLMYSSLDALKSLQLRDCSIGAMNFAARSMGIAVGTLLGARSRDNKKD